MKLENQVCAKEWSIKLEKLGVKQESLWWWLDIGLKTDNFNETDWGLAMVRPVTNELRSYKKDIDCDKQHYPNRYSAFTVAELGEMLPDVVESSRSQLGKYTDTIWKCEKYNPPHQVFANTEADCRAKMMIYLIENKLIRR